MRALLLSLVLAISLLSGCATTSQDSQGIYQSDDGAEAASTQANVDPFENFNRSVYGFNTALDRAIVKPAAKGYKEVVPQPVRTGVSNFFSNLLEPTTAVNELLQGKPTRAAQSLGRFVVNSTIGVLGIFDVATPMDIPKYKEDFGQTFAVWGMGSGPYLMLPFLGPSNLRDLGGTITRYALTDVSGGWDGDAATLATTVRLLDIRAGLLGFDETLDLQVDPYAFIREGYRQRRLDAIHDGNPPEAAEDEFEAELFDD